MASDKVSRIVVGYDYSPTSDLALRRGFELASQRKNAEVHVATVILMGDVTGAGIAGVPIYPTISIEDAHKALKARVQSQADEWRKSTGKSFERLVTHIRSEVPASEIAQLATDLEADIVVVGTHGRRGIQRFLLGSVAEGVVRMAPCEVLVVRPRDGEAEVPQIEPPCPKCLEERQRTNGAEFWCEQHRERHGQRHTYHYENRAAQDGNVSGLVGTR